MSPATASSRVSYIGIDPGLTGAISLLSDDGILFWDTPTLQLKAKRDYDISGLRSILQEAFSRSGAMALLEDVHSMPGEGNVGAFSFGRAKGILEGLLVGLQIPYTRVAPQSWKKLALLPAGSTKADTYLRACQLFPSAADGMNHNKSGRADALLIAAYGRAKAL